MIDGSTIWEVERIFGEPLRIIGSSGGLVAIVADGGYSDKELETANVIALAPFMLTALEELIAERDSEELPQGHYPGEDTCGIMWARQAVELARNGRD